MSATSSSDPLQPSEGDWVKITECGKIQNIDQAGHYKFNITKSHPADPPFSLDGRRQLNGRDWDVNTFCAAPAESAESASPTNEMSGAQVHVLQFCCPGQQIEHHEPYGEDVSLKEVEVTTFSHHLSPKDDSTDRHDAEEPAVTVRTFMADISITKKRKVLGPVCHDYMDLSIRERSDQDGGSAWQGPTTWELIDAKGSEVVTQDPAYRGRIKALRSKRLDRKTHQWDYYYQHGPDIPSVDASEDPDVVDEDLLRYATLGSQSRY